MRLEFGEYSIIGDRKNQQDSSRCEKSGKGSLLAGICDGMGGMEGGERASQSAIQTIFSRFKVSPPPDMGTAGRWLGEVLHLADRQVASLENAQGEPLRGGTTCVLILADENSFLWASVGDSSIYLLRNGNLFTLTRMHNFHLQLDMMLNRGEIGPEDRQRLGVKGEALISYLGMGNPPIVDVASELIPWQPEDILILCSDGLYKSLQPKQIQAIVEESGGNMQLASERLCLEAHRLGTMKQDNTTVITIRCKGT